MPEVARTAQDMIANMTPRLRPGDFVFVTLGDPARAAGLAPRALASFREDEGLSLILPVAEAGAAGLPVDQPMRCITLDVYSSLDGVGLTAAVSAALGLDDIPCNMVAAFHHDHVFVPSGMCDRAMRILTDLQVRSAAPDGAATKGPEGR